MPKLLENGDIATLERGYDPERNLFSCRGMVMPPTHPEYEKEMLWLSPEDRVKARRFLLKHRNTAKQEPSPAK